MSSNLRNKLSAYEANPPERVWENIASALDHQKPGSYSKRLLAYEVSPPPGIWSKIQSRINQLEKYDPGVIPFYRKYSKPLKYSGVAAIIITFGIIGSLLISKKTVSEVPANQTVLQAQPASNDFKAPEDVPINKRFTVNSGISMRPGILQERIARQIQSATGNTMALLEHVAPKFAQRNQAINFSTPSDAYMIYSDADGHAVRLPKKMFDVFVCPNDQLTCRQRLQKLQEKIASSSVTSDFTGMLEMLNNLQENQ